jgi:hypothetical protein
MSLEKINEKGKEKKKNKKSIPKIQDFDNILGPRYS